ncbi:hypothetical protein [Methylotenera sp. L2L1]|uniref:hypothetical protein n=1 Tax=Methylotenera sp. L2L1 TaxID=1502770 RepID=UPI0009DE8DF2|nr:hypothetical protein [Methylotenera sp. L2L1]
MNYSLNSVAFRIRLLFLTALISMLGFVFLAQLSDSSSYNDDTPRLRIAEIQEVTGDTEPPPQDGPPRDDLLSSIVFICTGFVVLALIVVSEVFPRLTFLSHVRPRSPPLF